MINIDELTVKQIKYIQTLLKGPTESTHPYEVGKNYFIRTVTHHFVGRLVKVASKELVLQEASWIADDGRFHDALQNGSLNEIEPYPKDVDVIIGRGSLIYACLWKHALPLEQK